MASRLGTWKLAVIRRKVDVTRRTKQAAKALKRWQGVQHDPKRGPAMHQALVDAQRRLKESQDALAAAQAAVGKLTPHDSLSERAYKEAEKLIGVMEQGGNNQGAMVTKIIRANGGTGPEPWCGDFVAYCYRRAGSKRVSRSWAAVALLRGLLGISATAHPVRGDLVRFTFDHVGIFVKDIGGGMIETIEGNTGGSGAVSDSSTGGDGVYRKHRSKGLVHDYLHVSG